MKTYRNILAIGLIVILALYFVIFGVENFWKVIVVHLAFLALFPILVFVHIFSKMVPIKENVSIQTVCETVFKKKCNLNKSKFFLLAIFLPASDFLFGGIYGFIDGWLTWWSVAAAVWLVLLTSYSYQVYINPSNKSEEPIKNPQADS